MDLIWLMLILIVPVIIYCCLKRIHKHWKNQNVPSIPDPNLIFGHMLPVITIEENVTEFVDRAYKSFKSSMVGFYFMRRPGIIVRDPDIVKKVLQTNFSSFHQNLTTLSEKNDPVLVKHPFFTSDYNLWKERRNRISNHLSSKNLRYLFVITQEICDKMNAFVERKILENGGFYECELKKHFKRCTGEVVANAAFAIEGQFFADNPNCLSFSQVLQSLFIPSFLNGIKQALIYLLPSVAKFFGLAMLEKRTDEFIRQNVKLILEKRRQTGETPKDYLQISMASSSDLNDILADVVNFFVDVYETSSSAMTNLFYHLSQNPEIQMKLRNHIITVLRQTNGQVTYESLKKMNYLDQVIHESLRLIPPIGVQRKCCTAEITLEGPDGVKCHLQPGNPIFIPGFSLQHDEKYWPNPEYFDPDRFSPGNQIHNNKYTFLPFGEGPKTRVGMSLGLMLVKQATATLIRNFPLNIHQRLKFL